MSTASDPAIATRALVALALAIAIASGCAAQDAPRNGFDDPFVQATGGIDDCPRPPGPRSTLAEMRAEAHSRAERGADCYRSGRCRLPNSYLYDREIVPRVTKALRADGRFADTSIWVEGRRRWVWLKGCVRTTDQSDAAERLARAIEDVEQVIDELVVHPAAVGPEAGSRR